MLFKKISPIIVILTLVAGFSSAQESYNPLTSTCWFTALQDITAYNDADLTLEHPAINVERGWRVQVMELRGTVALLAIDHAMGFWVETQYGAFEGECFDIPGYTPFLVTTLENARLWTEPDVINGTIITTLPEGTGVKILNPAELGRIQYDSPEMGLWYRVTDGVTTGWIWEARIEQHIAFPLMSVDAITTENARIWSRPDVTDGEVLYSPPADSAVQITGGPIDGRIRMDDPATGTWYQVFVNGVGGWMWEGRLTLRRLDF